MTDFKVLTLQEPDAWKAALREVDGAGISSQPEYCTVFEANGDGDPECIVFSGPKGNVVYPVMRRSLDTLPFGREVSAAGFDISTPYGYGGIYLGAEESARPDLMRDFRARFTEYAKDTNIVSEFIRFDPLVQNQLYCEGLIDEIRHHNENLFIDLTQSEECFLAGCRSRIRTGIRQTERLGLIMERHYTADTIRQFVDLYHQAMLRRQNFGYLNFRSEFFDDLFGALGEYIDLFTVQEGGVVLGAAITLRFGDTVEYYLAANRRLQHRPYVNHFLIIEIAKWAKRQGFQKLHLGGGSESIMYFKSSFTQDSMPYYVGSHVFDRARYAELIRDGQSKGVLPETLPEFFFPAYRAFRSKKSDRALLDALSDTKSA
ncbi:GNAT family N-acetyltransferase [Nisaea sp.]|uniref:GNAT family N-acetyltransferase n=1 Tax=Nisaea sp. TaxID=2024842 RepID=UPI003B52CF05